MSKEFEMIVGAERDYIMDPGFSINGFRPIGPTVDAILNRFTKRMRFAWRGQVENDPSFLQFIPYCLVTQGDRVFLMRRLENGEESRLHNKHSIGVGGHMNPIVQVSPIKLIEENMFRELNEEIIISFPQPDRKFPFEIIGLLFSDKTPVDMVHLGVIYRIDLPMGATVRIREKDQLKGKFVSFNEAATAPNLETWSKICLDEYLIN